jgi:hypothetical protein
MVFSLDYSNFSTMSDVKTYQIASIDTADPQIKIVLSFEVIIEYQTHHEYNSYS